MFNTYLRIYDDGQECKLQLPLSARWSSMDVESAYQKRETTVEACTGRKWIAAKADEVAESRLRHNDMVALAEIIASMDIACKKETVSEKWSKLYQLCQKLKQDASSQPIRIGKSVRCERTAEVPKTYM
ncbi:hypothetical protein CHS0354_031376 [Potamilus streckersoni]|uniref:Uncharacterized protein n=1 Tax=Potamilus streckersoni TaxID=2493646 RepID=A0AAE0SJT4_9BIVA|nr:hypothetical protein CHS0354_031376 [Potamilus streckersoni]